MGARPGDTLNVGDVVGWISTDGMATGRVVRVMTRPEPVGSSGRIGALVRASEDTPWFLVEAEISGARAAYRREALTRL